MLNLGHIRYSNCVPVHGRFLECGLPEGLTLVRGVPAELNRRLSRGDVDVAPASSIEFARHSHRYRILPDLSISAGGAVQTIQLLTHRPLPELRDGDRVALPTASATSVALVKIVMAKRYGIRPEYVWFDQDREAPLDHGADAALYIGDVAQRKRGRCGLNSYDLGTLWNEWTGLPFVFALWQTGAGAERDEELRRLAGLLRASRDWSLERLARLARRGAPAYGWDPAELERYWRSLRFDWDGALARGLTEFYRRAAEIGEIPVAPRLVFMEV